MTAGQALAATNHATFDADWAPRVHRDLIVDETGDDVILLHPTQARWALTNAWGLHVARLFDGSRTLADCAAAIATQHGLDSAEPVLDDLRAFTAQLHETNLLANLPLPDAGRPVNPPRIPDITLYLTEECNLRCKHCAVVEGRMPQTTLTADDCRALIDAHLALHPGATVSFTGGEILLHPDALDIIDHACASTPHVNVNTNGLLVNDAVADRLARSGAWIQVSLDGASPEMHDFIRGKGTFAKAWAAIERLCARGANQRILVATTLTRCVLGDVRDLIARVDAMRLRELRLLTLNKMKAATTHWDRIAPDPAEMQRVYRWLLLDLPRTDRAGKTPVAASFPGFVPDADPSGAAWCPLGETAIIDSQGVAYNCPTLRGAEWEIGRLSEGSLADIENSERNRNLREKMLQRRYAVPECAACAWRNFCQGGCSAFTALRSGDFYLNDEFCDFRRSLYREFVQRAATEGHLAPGSVGMKC
jgi:radical SAM protein with 4Fe4S-binding SPASM domain